MNEIEENEILDEIKNCKTKFISIRACTQEFSTKLCKALVKYKIEEVYFLHDVNLTEEALRELAKSKTLKMLNLYQVVIFGDISVLKENRSIENMVLSIKEPMTFKGMFFAPWKLQESDPLDLGQRNKRIHNMVKNTAILSVFILKNLCIGKDMANKIGKIVWESRFDKEWKEELLEKPTISEKLKPSKITIGFFSKFLFIIIIYFIKRYISWL